MTTAFPEQTTIRLAGFQVLRINFEVQPLKDLTAPSELHVDFGYSILKPEGQDKSFGVMFNLNIENIDKLFTLKVDAVGHFETSLEVNSDFLESSFVQLSAPAIAFPYLRSFITTITMNAGYSPIILPSFNFSNRPSEKVESLPVK